MIKKYSIPPARIEIYTNTRDRGRMFHTLGDQSLIIFKSTRRISLVKITLNLIIVKQVLINRMFYEAGYSRALGIEIRVDFDHSLRF